MTLARGTPGDVYDTPLRRAKRALHLTTVGVLPFFFILLFNLPPHFSGKDTHCVLLLAPYFFLLMHCFFQGFRVLGLVEGMVTSGFYVCVCVCRMDGWACKRKRRIKREKNGLVNYAYVKGGRESQQSASRRKGNV